MAFIGCAGSSPASSTQGDKSLFLVTCLLLLLSELLELFTDIGYHIIEFLKPMREKRAYYEAHPEEVDRILKEGTERARKTAKETMRKVKEAMKLNYFED